MSTTRSRLSPENCLDGVRLRNGDSSGTFFVMPSHGFANCSNSVRSYQKHGPALGKSRVCLLLRGFETLEGREQGRQYYPGWSGYPRMATAVRCRQNPVRIAVGETARALFGFAPLDHVFAGGALPLRRCSVPLASLR